jgi:hypothetical protein
MNDLKTDTEQGWAQLTSKLEGVLGKKTTDVNAVLFLIGIHELGQGPAAFTKEQKQDLMHIAVCKIFSKAGYYELTGLDADGWPHWNSLKPLPSLNLKEQELALKQHIIEYFETEIFN